MSATGPGRAPLSRDAVVAVLLFVSGLALSLVIGRRGLDAYDASIVFDGGWRVLLGEVPIRDFLAPYGTAAFVAQALLFRLLGVTWFALALHGAIVNGLFGVLAYAYLRLERASLPAAALFGALSTVVCGPPFGVAHAEQDAFLLSLATLVAAHAAVRRCQGMSVSLCWGLVPPLAALALLCKPIPTLLVLPALAFPLREAAPDGQALARRGLFFGAALSTALAAAGVLLLRVPLQRLWLCFVTLPFGTGAPRLHDASGALQGLLPGLAATPANELLCVAVSAAVILLRAISRWSWPYHVFLLVGAVPIASVVARLLPPFGPRARAAALALGAVSLVVPQAGFVVLPLAAMAGLAAPVFRWRAVSLQVRCAIFGATVAGVGYVYFLNWTPLSHAVAEALGLAALLAGSVGRLSSTNLLRCGVASGLLAATLAFSLLTNQEPESGAAFLFLAAGLSFSALEREGRALLLSLIASVSMWDAVRFHRSVNLPRKVILASPFVPDPQSAHLPAPMRFLLVQKGGSPSASDIIELCAFVQSRRENFLLVGQSGFLYGLTGRRSPDPALWIHPGLATPRPGTREFAAYSSELREALRRDRVRWVVIEEGRKARERLASLPWLGEALAPPPVLSVGQFLVFDAGDLFVRSPG